MTIKLELSETRAIELIEILKSVKLEVKRDINREPTINIDMDRELLIWRLDTCLSNNHFPGPIFLEKYQVDLILDVLSLTQDNNENTPAPPSIEPDNKPPVEFGEFTMPDLKENPLGWS